MPHHDKIVAESRANVLTTALKLLAEPGHWDEVWQMRDFAQAVLNGWPKQAATSTQKNEAEDSAGEEHAKLRKALRPFVEADWYATGHHNKFEATVKGEDLDFAKETMRNT